MADSDRNTPASAVLEALGFALFRRGPAGALRLYGEPPNWLRSLWPSLTTAGEPLPLELASPFLENFLIDADECWSAGGETRAQSGPWVEQTGDGTEISLEATALTAGGEAVLLLERLGEVFEAKKSMLQKARETVIAYQRLNSETQKKEILLSCIAEEMNTALANAITALHLLELEKNSPRTSQLLMLAMRATEDQQALINKVLKVFATELAGLYGRAGDAPAKASLGEVLPAARETVAAQFEEKQVELRVGESKVPAAQVAMDPEHLARVVTNLLENGLQNVPPGGEVSLEVVEEPDSVLLQVIDNGVPMPHDVCENFFSKDATATTEPRAPQLSLQFCRMAIEKCHGEIGYEAREKAGNCFWIRLPKPAAAA